MWIMWLSAFNKKEEKEEEEKKDSERSLDSEGDDKTYV